MKYRLKPKDFHYGRSSVFGDRRDLKKYTYPFSGITVTRPEPDERCEAPITTWRMNNSRCLRRKGHGMDGRLCKQHAVIYDRECS